MFFDQTRALPRTALILPVVFTATVLLSAALLFFVQPLFTRMVLPEIGGAPAVWTTAMLFFQTVLIVGYLYAHVLNRSVSARLQPIVHLTLWALALFFLPLGIPEGWTLDPTAPMAWQTLALYAVGVGVPFAFLSANAPLIQKWYARTDGPSADDPYFLYAASNFGSLVALLGFPLIAEPIFGITQISFGWMIGFVVLGGLMGCAALFTLSAPVYPDAEQTEAATSTISVGRLARWTLIAFVPSSLMLSVTTKISIDIGSFPLVWVVPLSLYLLTFVLVFTNSTGLTPRVLRFPALAALALLTPLFAGLQESVLPLWTVGLLVVLFFLVALYGHARLYADRPEPAHLTTFYLAMSFGGALGGLFNSILAPILFDRFLEGLVTLSIAATLFIGGKATPRQFGRGVAGGLLLYAVAVTAIATGWLSDLNLALACGFLLAIILFSLRSSGWAVSVALFSGALILIGASSQNTIYLDRSFFGQHTIFERDATRFYSNGSTLHGGQFIGDLGSTRPSPLFYYHEGAPLGQILGGDRGADAKRIGVIGLGVGALACYARPEQDWHFFEIDPMVDRLARDPKLFSFVSACTPRAPTHLGDARIVLENTPAFGFDILVVDAYSSDAVPIHLTTNEAMDLYLSHLSESGVLVYHISNRYYDISLPLSRSAADLGVQAFLQDYDPVSNGKDGKVPSRVVVIARTAADIERYGNDARWTPLASDEGRLWTDDYANPLSILRSK